jgi:rod shape-determining protein MreC
VADTVIGVRDTRRTRQVLVVLLVIALALIAVGYSDRSSPLLRGLRHVSGSVFGGIEHAASAVGGFFTGSGSSTSQVHQLQQQLATLRGELSAAQLSKSQYDQLRKLLLLAGTGRYKIVAASVTAVGQGFQQTVSLDAGSADGVKAGDTVLNGQGLVGQVTAVTAGSSTVLLATDASAVIGVAVAPSGELGYVSGPGQGGGTGGLLRLRMLNSAAVLKPGQQLVTAASKSRQSFAPGVPVGTIAKVMNRTGALTATALVRPFADFTALSVVGVVIVRPAHNPRFAVLPPIPHPAPAITVTVTPRAGGRPGTSPSVTPSPGSF